MRLHFGIAADHYFTLDFYKGADKAICTDLASIQIDRFHYFHIFSESHIFYLCFPSDRFIHNRTADLYIFSIISTVFNPSNEFVVMEALFCNTSIRLSYTLSWLLIEPT